MSTSFGTTRVTSTRSQAWTPLPPPKDQAALERRESVIDWVSLEAVQSMQIDPALEMTSWEEQTVQEDPVLRALETRTVEEEIEDREKVRTRIVRIKIRTVPAGLPTAFLLSTLRLRLLT